jgi:transcriptional regulator with XRE-family HTH domain
MAQPLLARPMTNMEAARRQKGWSQKDLGDQPRVRIHQTFISMIERGIGVPMPDQLARLSRVLNVPAEQLLQPVDVPETEVAVPPVATGGSPWLT